MKTFTGKQTLNQLDPRKGGYFYLVIQADLVNQLSQKRATRLVCTIDDRISLRCGLNHLGDGNFYIIIAKRHFEKLNKHIGESVAYSIHEDPDQLGVDVPEVLSVLLEQDPEARAIYEKLTDGRKRTLIYSFNRIKDIDKQVKKIIDFLAEEKIKLKL